MQPEKLKKASALKMILSRYATGKAEIKDEENYKLIRSEFIIDKSVKPFLPHFIISFRILEDFWPFIKKLNSTYEGRREYIREQFEPLLTYLETSNLLVHDNIIGYTIEKFDCDTVNYMWGKALERRNSDPDGAITAARSLLESVCKQILIERHIAYDNTYDLPKLYKETSRSLNLAPQLHSQNNIKQILSGMQSTVYGFSSLRNELSDAHGKPKGGYRASKRHAELAVNLAGATASFLIQTHKEVI